MWAEQQFPKELIASQQPFTTYELAEQGCENLFESLGRDQAACCYIEQSKNEATGEVSFNAVIFDTQELDEN